MQLKINKLCPVAWESLTPTTQGGYCNQCNLEVIDFTNKTEEEIKSYFANHQNTRVCGRIKTIPKPTWGLRFLGLTALLSFWSSCINRVNTWVKPAETDTSLLLGEVAPIGVYDGDTQPQNGAVPVPCKIINEMPTPEPGMIEVAPSDSLEKLGEVEIPKMLPKDTIHAKMGKIANPYISR